VKVKVKEVEVEGREDGGRRVEDGGQRAEGGGPESGERKAESGGRRVEGGGRRTIQICEVTDRLSPEVDLRAERKSNCCRSICNTPYPVKIIRRGRRKEHGHKDEGGRRGRRERADETHRQRLNR
jgi:hypothetical protein